MFGSDLNSVGIYGSLFVGLILVWLSVVVRVRLSMVLLVFNTVLFVLLLVGCLGCCCLPLIGCGSWALLLGCWFMMDTCCNLVSGYFGCVFWCGWLVIRWI